MTAYEIEPPPGRIGDCAQIRRAWTRGDGDLDRFLVQLEYWLDGDWRPVIRYDHDVDGAHDVTEEGVHRDVYRDGAIWRTEFLTETPVDKAGSAMDMAEDDLVKRAEEYIRRFERWHNLRDNPSP